MQAVVVENVAGELSSRLTDTKVTELTITGSLDARDFKYMADKCNDLTAVDLSGAKIFAYEGAEPVFGQQITYQADEIPQTSFFGKPLTSVVLPSGVRTSAMRHSLGVRASHRLSFLPRSTASAVMRSAPQVSARWRYLPPSPKSAKERFRVARS